MRNDMRQSTTSSQTNLNAQFNDMNVHKYVPRTEFQLQKQKNNSNDKAYSLPFTSKFPIPELSETVQYHLFVAHASEDRERVVKIVEELERKYGVRCLFSDRDFQAGKKIWTNIEEGLNKSQKVLMIFTPKYIESHNCQLETETAYSMMIYRGNDCVIPLLLEDCEIPATLKPRTYIDATLPSMDLGLLTYKIMESLVRIESPLEVLPSTFTSKNSEYKNGVHTMIPMQISGGFNCRKLEYRLQLRKSNVNEVTGNNINASPRLIQKVISMLNDDPTVRDLCYTKRRLCLWGLCTFPSIQFFCLSIFLGMLVLMSTDHPSEEVARMIVYSHGVAWVPAAMTVLICTCLFLFGYVKRSKDLQNLSNVKDKLWREFSSQTLVDGVLFRVRFDVPALYIMRYHVKPCKQYVMTLLTQDTKNKEENLNEHELENLAEDIIKRYAKKMCSLDLLELGLPKAEHNRHNVIEDRKCLCQLYQDPLFLPALEVL